MPKYWEFPLKKSILRTREAAGEAAAAKEI
jgi:hypothetical protein